MAVVNGATAVVILLVSVALSAGTLTAITKGLLWTMKRRADRG